jgi:hypothetical protein
MELDHAGIAKVLNESALREELNMGLSVMFAAPGEVTHVTIYRRRDHSPLIDVLVTRGDGSKAVLDGLAAGNIAVDEILSATWSSERQTLN